MQPRDLIKTARELVAANKGKPRQANLHRATSTAYYALFHTLAKTAADLLVGTEGAKRSKPAWIQVYRSLVHADIRNSCANQTVMAKFPQGIRDFANAFVTMQAKRHDADYNPTYTSTKSQVDTDINAAEVAIVDFLACSAKDKRAFAVWVLMKTRKS